MDDVVVSCAAIDVLRSKWNKYCADDEGLVDDEVVCKWHSMRATEEFVRWTV
jgi:hypothetical protein